MNGLLADARERAWRMLGPDGVNRIYRAIAGPRRVEPRPPAPWEGPPSVWERLRIGRQDLAYGLCHALFVGEVPPVPDADLPPEQRGLSDEFYAMFRDRPAELWALALERQGDGSW